MQIKNLDRINKLNVIDNKKAIKNSKGITLIALAITIIIILLLAGVTIAMLTGKNGVLTQAINAKEQTKIAKLKEEIQLARTR